MAEFVPAVKPWYKSKTMWFNIAIGLVATANEMAPVLNLFSDEIANEMRAYFILLGAVGNTILRIVTSSKVTL